MHKFIMTAGYATVTELPGARASQEQLARLFGRYHFASKFCIGKDVLEVACGAGIGLGYLSRVAKSVTGGDIDDDILQFPNKHYATRDGIKIISLDAERLPSADNSFDVVILYEAIYYLRQPTRFVTEARRVLRDEGTLIICTVNKDWSDFNPSPYSTKYFSATELFQLLRDYFLYVELYGAFLAAPSSIGDKIVSVIKRAALTLHLIPKSMKGKEFFKRIFFGQLTPLPNEIREGMCAYVKPEHIPHYSPSYQHKVLYAVARK